MPKTFDFNLRNVPTDLVGPLMELVADRCKIEHIGETPRPNGSATPSGDRSAAWANKHAVAALSTLRELAKEGDSMNRGVFYLDVGHALAQRQLIGIAKSVSPIFTQLVRAGKARKVSRGRYLPTA